VGSSFVFVGDHGFWSRDWIYADWLLLLAREADAQDPSSLATLRDEWRLWGLVRPTGCVPGSFDEVAADPELCEQVLLLADSACAWLERLPADIPKPELRSLFEHSVAQAQHLELTSTETGLEPYSASTALYLNFFGLLRGLLTGRVLTRASSPITYWRACWPI